MHFLKLLYRLQEIAAEAQPNDGVSVGGLLGLENGDTQETDEEGLPVVELNVSDELDLTRPFLPRKFGPQDPKYMQDATTDADQIERLANLDVLHHQLFAHIRCPRMRHALINQIIRRSLALDALIGEAATNADDLPLHKSQSTHHNKDEFVPIWILSLPGGNLDREAPDWWPTSRYPHSVHRAHWFELSDALDGHPPEIPSISWSLWEFDGTINWPLLSFLALSAACIMVWSALLVQFCITLTQNDFYDDEEFDRDFDSDSEEEEFRNAFYERLYDEEEQQQPKKVNNSSTENWKGVKNVVEKAAEYTATGNNNEKEYLVTLQYMPLPGGE